jgi:hypothetical protein
MFVLVVILLHAGNYPTGGNFVSVDAFFVISGYLMASLLWNDTESGTFSLRSFYERRVRRIQALLLADYRLLLPAIGTPPDAENLKPRSYPRCRDQSPTGRGHADACPVRPKSLLFYEKNIMYGNNCRIERLSRKREEAALQTNSRLAACAKGLDNVDALSWTEMFGSGRRLFIADSDVPCIVDGLHISVHGAQHAAMAFLKTRRGYEVKIGPDHPDVRPRRLGRT